MGKGDKRSAKGKRFRQSYGKSRPKARTLKKKKEAALAPATPTES